MPRVRCRISSSIGQQWWKDILKTGTGRNKMPPFHHFPNEEYGYSKHASNFKAVRLGKDLGDLEMGSILR